MVQPRLLAAYGLWYTRHHQVQALTSILNNEAALDYRFSSLDTPAPVPGQKDLHFWRLQLVKRPVHNTVRVFSYA